MSAYYNDKKEGVEYSTLNVTNWDEVNVCCNFDELHVKKDDIFYYLFFYPSKVTGVSKYGGERDWKFPKELSMTKIAHKEYKRKDWKTKQEVTCAPSEIEKLISSVLDETDLEKIYSGEFWLNNSTQVESVNTGVTTRGKKMSEDVKESLLETYFSLAEVKEPEYINPEKLSIPKSSFGSFGGRGGQTEAQKIQDRFDYIANQIKVAIPDSEIKSMNDVLLVLTNTETSATVSALLDLCTHVIK